MIYYLSWDLSVLMPNVPCWQAVEVLARAVMDEHVTEPVMNGERAHEIID